MVDGAAMRASRVNDPPCPDGSEAESDDECDVAHEEEDEAAMQSSGVNDDTPSCSDGEDDADSDDECDTTHDEDDPIANADEAAREEKDPDEEREENVRGLTSCQNGYGALVWAQINHIKLSYRISDLKVALQMVSEVRAAARPSRLPRPENDVVDELKTRLGQLAASVPSPIYNAEARSHTLFLFLGGCAPAGAFDPSREYSTERLEKFIIDRLRRQGHHAVVVSQRHCGEACQQVRQKPRRAGLCADMTVEDRNEARKIFTGALEGLFPVENFKYAGDPALVAVNGQTCRLVSGERRIVYIIVGARAAACLTLSMLRKLQEGIPHAYVPHLSRCNVMKSAVQVALALKAFGVHLSAEDFQKEAMQCITERTGTEESRSKRKLTFSDPAYKKRRSDKLIARGLRTTMDSDMLERLDFTKSKHYRIRCKCCDLVFEDRCVWTGHCRSSQHMTMAAVVRDPLFDPAMLHVTKEQYRGLERKLFECQICWRRNKKVVLRPKIAIQHLKKRNHLFALRCRAEADAAASGSAS
jgi:hypothetical protein